MLGGALITISGDASANPEDMLRAENLFREGKAAFEAGNYATGCPLLAESQELDPAGGTLLALALCYEGWGKKATAWAIYKEAEAFAVRQGRKDRVQIAQQRIAELEPNLAYLFITLAPDAPSGVLIFRNDERLAPTDLGVKAAVDAGEHQLRAVFEGTAYFEHRMAITAGASESVTIPAPSVPRPQATPRKVTSPPSDTRPKSSRTLDGSAPRAGWLEAYVPHAVMGVGVTLVGVGLGFGYGALQKNKRIERDCPDPDVVCSKNAVRRQGDETSAADYELISTWMTTAGLLGVGVAGYLFYSRQEPEAERSAVHVTPTANGARLDWTGTF